MAFQVQQIDDTFALVNLITGTTVASVTAADVIALNATSITMSREAIAATGSDAAGAAVLAKQVSAVTASDGAKGVALPAAATTTGPLLIINTVATASLLVYPLSGGNDNINGGAEDAAWTMAPGEAAWFVPVSATQWWVRPMSDGGAAGNSRAVTTTATITAADHNKIVFLNSATGFVTTLPAPIAGFRCKVISKLANTSGNHTVVSASSANIIKGQGCSAQATSFDTGTADDTISFVANSSVAGDSVELFSDGTSWFAHALATLTASITFTQAST